MRFFKLACVFGLLVASLGCIRNWNQLSNSEASSESSRSTQIDRFAENNTQNRYRNWVKPQGTDSRSREIEKNLGIR